MSRYNADPGIEGEYEPGSAKRVLKNLLGIKTKTEMDRAEDKALEAVQQAYYENGIVTAETQFTVQLIRKMHKDWLGGIYEWAGDYRTVEMEKGGFRWPPAHLVDQNMAGFERETLSKHTPCRGATLADVCRSIAVVHADLLLIHPFREGNGRIARWMADLMAAQAGYPPPMYMFQGRGSRTVMKRYLDAVIAGYAGRYDRLSDFFEDAVALRLTEPE